MKTNKLFLILAGIIFITATPAVGVTLINSCADADIWTSGNYVLNADLPCGIYVHRSNVTVKLNGHKLTGPGDGIRIEHDTNHISIEGPGLVRNFQYGFVADGCQHCLVRQVTFAQNEVGMYLAYSLFLTIESNLVVGSNDDGLLVHSVADSSFSFNNITGNSRNGMFLRLLRNITVNNNVVSGNGGNGLQFNQEHGYTFERTRVYSNTIDGNGESGINIWLVGANDSANKFFNNSARGNKLFDVEDVDPCIKHVWADNVFFIANQACIR